MAVNNLLSLTVKLITPRVSEDEAVNSTLTAEVFGKHAHHVTALVSTQNFTRAPVHFKFNLTAQQHDSQIDYLIALLLPNRGDTQCRHLAVLPTELGKRMDDALILSRCEAL